MVTIEGEHHASASREQLWQALTDPATFAQAIDACDRVDTEPDGSYRAHVTVQALGSHRSQDILVAVKDPQPPESLVLALAAKTPAGNVDGSLKIVLGMNADGTPIQYRLETELSGVLAALGPRLVEVTVRRMMTEFFTRLDDQLQA